MSTPDQSNETAIEKIREDFETETGITREKVRANEISVEFYHTRFNAWLCSRLATVEAERDVATQSALERQHQLSTAQQQAREFAEKVLNPDYHFELCESRTAVSVAGSVECNCRYFAQAYLAQKGEDK